VQDRRFFKVNVSQGFVPSWATSRRKDFNVLMNRPNNSLNVTAQPVFKLGKLGLLQRKVLVGWLRHLVDSALNSLPVSLTFLKLRVRLATFSARSAQQQMDAQRGELQDQAQYGMTQVGQLSNLLRGVPLSDTTQQNTTPPPSFASQLTGLGLTGLSLYNLLGNK
jgi:hypothetical protein